MDKKIELHVKIGSNVNEAKITDQDGRIILCHKISLVVESGHLPKCILEVYPESIQLQIKDAKLSVEEYLEIAKKELMAAGYVVQRPKRGPRIKIRTNTDDADAKTE